MNLKHCTHYLICSLLFCSLISTTGCHNEVTSSSPYPLRNKGELTEKQGVYYEIFVRAFADSNGDGIGDLNGVTGKLDELKELGIDGLWLMPINASPSYHGYDVTDYYAINSDYGTEEDFKKLLEEAHARDMTVIMDFVANHTSSSHPWFLDAISSPTSPYRDYYRFVSADDRENFDPSDVSPWYSPVWHSFGNVFYYGIFWSEMPDLNYNNPKVREEMKNAASKWLTLGVDGFRLDGALHIYGQNEFKNEDATLMNLAWWNEFALACEAINPNVYLVGEVWQDNDIFAEYVQPFDTKFDFGIANQIIFATKNRKALTSYGENLASYIEDIYTAYDDVDSKYINGIFATNHDQDRLLSSVVIPQKAHLVSHIYLTLPGNPFIYYGEEIGMKGNKPDELIRLDYKWTENTSLLPNTHWRLALYGQEDNLNQDTPSLESQLNDTTSTYQLYKTLIALRKAHPALSNGNFKALVIDAPEILSYTRTYEAETLYVLHNLSSKPVTFNCDFLKDPAVIYTSDTTFTLTTTSVHLPPYSSIVLK